MFEKNVILFEKIVNLFEKIKQLIRKMVKPVRIFSTSISIHTYVLPYCTTYCIFMCKNVHLFKQGHPLAALWV
jgi:hypothetical protein